MNIFGIKLKQRGPTHSANICGLHVSITEEQDGKFSAEVLNKVRFDIESQGDAEIHIENKLNILRGNLHNIMGRM